MPSHSRRRIRPHRGASPRGRLGARRRVPTTDVETRPWISRVGEAPGRSDGAAHEGSTVRRDKWRNPAERSRRNRAAAPRTRDVPQCGDEKSRPHAQVQSALVRRNGPFDPAGGMSESVTNRRRAEASTAGFRRAGTPARVGLLDRNVPPSGAPSSHVVVTRERHSIRPHRTRKCDSSGRTGAPSPRRLRRAGS